MELSIGFVDNNDQLTIATLGNNAVTTALQPAKISDSQDSKDELNQQDSFDNLFGIIYEGQLPTLNLGNPAFISSKETLPLSSEMSFTEIMGKLKEHSGHVSLKEISKTLENITSLGDQFKDLYNSSRNEFFKEVWSLIRRCFVSQHLSIFYYNIDKNRDGKLSLQKVSGQNTAIFAQTSDEELTMFDTIKPHISPSPSVLSYDFDKGELTLCAQINGTSFLVLAKVFQFTLLQRTLFISLINGVNHQLGKKTSKKASS